MVFRGCMQIFRLDFRSRSVNNTARSWLPLAFAMQGRTVNFGSAAQSAQIPKNVPITNLGGFVKKTSLFVALMLIAVIGASTASFAAVPLPALPPRRESGDSRRTATTAAESWSTTLYRPPSLRAVPSPERSGKASAARSPAPLRSQARGRWCRRPLIARARLLSPLRRLRLQFRS